MKKLLLIAALFTGLLVSKVSAASVSSTFTAVCLTSSTDMELTYVAYSTGSPVLGQSFLVLVDTPSIYIRNAPGQILPLADDKWDPNRWPGSQMILPPMVIPSTGSSASGSQNSWTFIDLRDAQGNGIPIKNALIGFKAGQDYGTTVTYGIRKRRTSVEH